MTKLIIRHGEHVTEHQVSDHPVVMGRDPQCDLFFADKKLSRRHARFEKTTGGIRLVDLGSRNGCWVNEERVDDVVLTPEDSVRLGSLMVSVEAEPSDETRSEDEDSTVFLSSETPAEDSHTVVLPSESLPDASAVDEAGTVMLPSTDRPETRADTASPPSDTEDEDPTLRKPDTGPPGSGGDHTVMLEGEGPRVDADTGTVIFRESPTEPADDSTRLVPPEEAPSQEAWDAEAEPPPVSFDDVGSEAHVDAAPRATTSGTLRFVALVVAVGVLAFAVLALPLIRTLGSALTNESALRGRVLVDLLAASNEAALRENRPDTLTTARVSSEPGVLGAFVLDPMGRVLAPQSEANGTGGSVLASLGADVRARDIRTYRESRVEDGTIVYALPVRAEGRRVGVAVLHYRTAAATPMWTGVMLVLGSVLLLMGVGGAVLMARRWTLAPVQELRDDVEALRRGMVSSLAEDRPYSDLVVLARSFNELTGQDQSPTSDESAETYRPDVDPTFVPDEPDERKQAGR